MDKIKKEELEKYDGKQNNKIYVAYAGKVYDVTESRLWRTGEHLKTHKAGHDLTRGMAAAPHGPEVLDKFKQVAELIEEKEAKPTAPAFKTPPPLVALLLDRHPHPITIHFPIGLSLTGVLFTFLSLFLSSAALETAGLYNLIIAAATTPVSIITGLLSWSYNYSAIWTHIYRMKVLLSVILIILLAAALIIHLGVLPETSGNSLWLWSYRTVVFAIAPTVVALGYYGGKVTFPS